MRWGGLVLVVWGAALLYAAWKPSSVPGRILMLAHRPGTGIATLRQYWFGAVGFICVVLGLSFVVLG